MRLVCIPPPEEIKRVVGRGLTTSPTQAASPDWLMVEGSLFYHLASTSANSLQKLGTF
jgi:hypothetical protein